MSDEDARLLTITFGDGWREVSEHGFPLIEIPNLLLSNSDPVHAVFVRAQMNGYPTRLFFDRPLQPKQHIQMTTHPFRGKVMYAHSINSVPSTLSPHEAILAHLRMYTQ